MRHEEATDGAGRDEYEPEKPLDRAEYEANVQCCAFDTNRDGNCHVHSAPGVLRNQAMMGAPLVSPALAEKINAPEMAGVRAAVVSAVRAPESITVPGTRFARVVDVSAPYRGVCILALASGSTVRARAELVEMLMQKPTGERFISYEVDDAGNRHSPTFQTREQVDAALRRAPSRRAGSSR